MNSKFESPGITGSSPVDKVTAFANNIVKLAALFECPVCFDQVLPPILQCQNGHIICNSCRSRISTCPTCRISYGNRQIRNLSLEKMATTLYFPCKYFPAGCTEQLFYKDKPDHEGTKCPFKPYNCPCPGVSCPWKGPLNQIVAHLSDHRSVAILTGTDIIFLVNDYNLSGSVGKWVMIQSCYDHHFMLVVEKVEKFTNHQQFFATVVLIGSDKQAKKFIYRLELKGQKRRLFWEATPRSISDAGQSATSFNDCLVFDTTVAQHFSEDGNLAINVTISPA